MYSACLDRTTFVSMSRNIYSKSFNSLLEIIYGTFILKRRKVKAFPNLAFTYLPMSKTSLMRVLYGFYIHI